MWQSLKKRWTIAPCSKSKQKIQWKWGKKDWGKREILPPQQHWEKEKLPKDQNYLINNFAAQHQPTQPLNISVSSTARNPPRQSYTVKFNSDKSSAIRKVSSQITAKGEDGVEILEDKSVFHNGFQVYRSSAYKRKINWLEKLK